MIKFKKYLNEGISSKSVPTSLTLIHKYLEKKTKLKMFQYPAIESFKNSKEKGFGVRYFVLPYRSFRLNWKTSAVGMNSISSFDIWNGKSRNPDINVSFDEDISLVKILPILASLLKSKGVKPGRVYTRPDGVALNESTEELTEAVGGTYNPEDMYNEIIDIITSPEGFTKTVVWKQFKSSGIKVLETIIGKYNFFNKVGRNTVWAGTPKQIQTMVKDQEAILRSSGIVRGVIAKGGNGEKIDSDPAIDKLEADRERISYESQIADLENLVRMVIAGASNGLFVAGKGGIGKTFTVEKILSSMGMQDGRDYFKNTGSASAAGIYSTLFKYRDKVLFFDDSDDALKDQQARNIFKAAMDTKKSRKLVWNKQGANVMDPDEMDEGDIDAGKIPRYFEFEGKVIFISNLKLNKLDPDGALRTRAFIIEIDPTDTEIYEFMEKIVDKIPLEDGLSLSIAEKKKVVKLLKTGKSKQAPNLRKLSRGLNMLAGADQAGVSIADKDLQRMIETYA